jgi:membrane peptidoglycan carboxypeptidase
MTSSLPALRITLLTFLLVIVSSTSFAKATAGKDRLSKTQAQRTALLTKKTKAQAPKLAVKAARSRQGKHGPAASAQTRSESRSSKLAKAQLRIQEQRLEAKRLAERQAYVRAIASQREGELRNQVQSMIARDDLAGEDPEIRRVAVAALGNHAGTVVVMNPQTGRVYSMVNQQWALREGFKPCSTIKLVTGLAGLNENVIDPTDTTKISDRNQVSLTRALAYSKNEYFQQVGKQVGFDQMVAYARRLGLGEKTGINASNEIQGSVPGPGSRLAESRMWSHGDNFQVTPIQLATLVSAMANGGKLLSPRIASTKQDDFKVKVRRLVKMDSESWRNMIPGMVGSVSYGSGKRAFDPSETVAGKTGTCVENGTWVGLFTSYAPLANPRLAVVVIARGADAHNHFPAAVAGKIYRDLNGRFGTPTNLQIATTRKPLVINGVRQESDDEEDEEPATVRKSWTEANNIGGINPTRGTQPPLNKTTGRSAESKVTPVLMQIPTRKQEAVRPPTGPARTPSTVPKTVTRPRRVFGA